MRHIIRHAGLILLAFFFTGLMSAAECGAGQQGANADRQQLHSLIAKYFTSWSKPDMAAYKGCFHPLASIYPIDDAGNPHYAGLDTFIAAQEKAHQEAREQLSEKPTRVSLSVHGRLARAAVRWKLYKGSHAVTGTDYFTFIKTDAGWRILNLVFEQDKK